MLLSSFHKPYLCGPFIKFMKDSSSHLPIMEHFYTIQGEGAKTGTSAYFIRLAGCDVGCSWCDVKESWDAKNHSRFSLEEIVAWTDEGAGEWVVITGGEPCMYDLQELTRALHAKGKKIALETSGAYPIQGEFDWVCLSPKKFKAPLAENWPLVNELKVICYNQHDFKWGEEMAQNIHHPVELFFQPEWGKRDVRMSEIVDYVKRNPTWRISLQTHKYLDIP